MPAPKSSSSSGSSKPPGKRAGTSRTAARGAKSTASSARKGAASTATQAKSGATKTRRASGSAARSTAKTAAAGAKGTATAARTGAKRTTSQAKNGASATARATKARGGVSDSIANLAEELANRVLNPLDLVMLTRDRIQEVLDEAAERGRVTRDDANEVVSELVKRGREQTEAVLSDLEQLVGKGRDQIGTVTKRARRAEPVDRIVRTADRARRTVGVGPSFPILAYDELTAGQVEDRLPELTVAQLRKVRDYERRHANRKSVLAGIEKRLG